MSVAARQNGSSPARDVAFERDWTEQAAQTVHAGSERLIAFAELRAGGGPVRDAETRNFLIEALAELADTRNYLCWAAQQVLRVAHDPRASDAAGESIQQINIAIAHTAAAFDAVDRAKALRAELKGAIRA